jgi:hypothetical protein
LLVNTGAEGGIGQPAPHRSLGTAGLPGGTGSTSTRGKHKQQGAVDVSLA